MMASTRFGRCSNPLSDDSAVSVPLVSLQAVPIQCYDGTDSCATVVPIH